MIHKARYRTTIWYNAVRYEAITCPSLLGYVVSWRPDSAHIVKSFADRDAGLQPGPGVALLDLGEHIDQIRFVAHPIHFGESIDLLGYELQTGMLRNRIDPLNETNQQAFSRAAALQINLYWHVQSRIPTDYTRLYMCSI
jgi:hypothetical protein